MPRILIVDDDEGVCTAIEALLEYEDFETVVADSGPHGLPVLQASRFDAVIVDIFMPGMDGFETIRAIQTLDPAVPIIAISGGTARNAGERAADFLAMATKLGAARALRKPFLQEELLEAVTGCLVAREKSGRLS